MRLFHDTATETPPTPVPLRTYPGQGPNKHIRYRRNNAIVGRRVYKTIRVVLHGLTAQTSDIERILVNAGYSGSPCTDSSLARLRKTNQTILIMSYASTEHVRRVLDILASKSLNGARITAEPYPSAFTPKWDPLHISPQSGPGKAVSIDGLPYLTNAGHLRRVLAGYELVDNPEFRFYMIYREGGKASWLVRTKSEDEAQRIVRNVHATYYRPAEYGKDYPLAAEVFY